VCRILTQRTASLPVLLKEIMISERNSCSHPKAKKRIVAPARHIPSRHQAQDLVLHRIESETGDKLRRLLLQTRGPPILYASCYAALTRHLYNDLDVMPESSRQEWIGYIQGFQKENGLFLDPMIETPLAEEVDWWGWRHLTLHALMALAALGGSAENRFELLQPFKKKGYISTWLESRNWRLDPASVSNEIQNHAVILQYARDFQGETWCEDSLRTCLIGWTKSKT